jgi:hypothetical protein
LGGILSTFIETEVVPQMKKLGEVKIRMQCVTFILPHSSSCKTKSPEIYMLTHMYEETDSDHLSFFFSFTAPNNHLLLSYRSHAFFQLSRFQAALEDADTVVRLFPTWGKVSKLLKPGNLSALTPQKLCGMIRRRCWEFVRFLLAVGSTNCTVTFFFIKE